MIKIIYFSPTGNTRYIAETLHKCLGETRASIMDLEESENWKLKGAEHLVFLFSIHGFNPPRMVREYIQKLPEGLSKNISLVAVGCAEAWVNEAATSGLRSALEKKGYRIVADKVIAMPLTFIMAFPEEMATKLVSESSEKVTSLVQQINEDRPSDPQVSRKARIIHRIGRLEGSAAKLFGLELHATKKCVSCGLCGKGCPAQNIRYKRNNKPAFGLKCLMCLKCIYNCPQKAITPWTAKFIPIKEGYSLNNYLPVDQKEGEGK